MDWVVFGDDWGRHASTTQHLVSHLPATDRVVWIDSLGMREPQLTRVDLARVVERVAQLRSSSWAPLEPPDGDRPRSYQAPPRLHPFFIPYHRNPLARAANRLLFARAWARPLAHLRAPIALVANPVAAAYLDLVSPSKVAYLRLDDFANLPGVDPRIVAEFEPALLATPPRGLATLVAAPNARLLADVDAPTLWLPQGVDPAAFAIVPLTPPDTRVVGFWGLISPWLDQDLVLSTARQHPDWTFELRGPVGTDTSRLDLPNIRLLPAVPHSQLAAHAVHWRAAWAPLRADPSLSGLSPLKLREYLAAGFPTASTPLPEAHLLPLTLVGPGTTLDAFLADALSDTPAKRQARRDSQNDATWSSRAHLLRHTVASLPASPLHQPRARFDLSTRALRSKHRS